MLLSFDEMIIFISDGFSSSLLLTWLPRQMDLSNITAQSLQNLLSFSKYLSRDFHGVRGYDIPDTWDATTNKTDYVPDLFAFYQSGRQVLPIF